MLLLDRPGTAVEIEHPDSVDVVYDSSHACWFSPVVCYLVLTPVYIADCVWPYRLHGCFPPLLLRRTLSTDSRLHGACLRLCTSSNIYGIIIEPFNQI